MASGSDYVKRLDAVDFPAAPEVVIRLSNLLSEEWVTAEQLSEVMAHDAGISARVLRLANSGYFRGQGGRSVAEAVLRVDDVPRVQAWAFINSLRGWLDAQWVG